MQFIFKDVSSLETSTLSQGDVIARTADVVQSIQQAHQYYASSPEYTHFVVLTQSCDLVRRRGVFKAPYITIAAARPFERTIKVHLDAQAKTLAGSSFKYFMTSLKNKTKQLLERHINNTEDEYFFLPKDGHQSLPEDLVVYLRLSVALRKDHYDVLASAKIAELADVFQAKLGWLTGNIYSRVATPDIEERGINATQYKSDFYNRYVPQDKTVWLSSLQAALLKKITQEKIKVLERDLSEDEVLSIIENEIPEDVRIIADNIVERLVKNKLIDTGDAAVLRRFATVISNEPSLKSLVKQND